MATAKTEENRIEEVEDEKKLCGLCMGPLSDPRSLPCKHVYCKICLDPLVVSDTIICPDCKMELKLPVKKGATSPVAPPVPSEPPPVPGEATPVIPSGEGGPRASTASSGSQASTGSTTRKMHVNVKQVRDEIHQFLKPPQDLKIWCEFCKPRSVVARVVCQDCNKSQCEKCSDKHRLTPLFQTHKYVSLTDRTVCKTHRGELIKVYCEQCHTGICVVCAAGDHGGHDLSDINMNAEPKKHNLKDWSQAFKDIQRTHARARAGFNTTHVSMDGKYTAAEVAVKEWYNKALRLLHDKCNEVLSNLATRRLMEIQKLEAYEAHVELLDAQNALNEYVVKVIHGGSSAEVVNTSDSLPRFPPVAMPVVPTFDLPIFKLVNVEAMLDTCIVKYQPTNQMKEPVVVGATDSAIIDGTSSDGESETQEMTPHIPIETITIDSAGLSKFAEVDLPTRATGIAWDKANDNFYIKELTYTRIFDSVGKELGKLDHGGWEGEGICIDRKRDLVVSGEYNKLKLYNKHTKEADGEIAFAGFFSAMFSFSVSDLTYCPKGDCYIVSDTATMGSKIMVVDATSRKIITKGAGNAEEGSKLVYPCHVKCDCNTIQSRSLIAISDRDDNNVKLFTAGGQFKGTFGKLGSGIGELHEPLGLAFDVEGRLLVADHRNSRVVRFWDEDGRVWWQTVLNAEQLGGGYPSVLELTNDGRLVVVCTYKNVKGKVLSRRALFFSNYK